jgi:DNA-binding MarR family transcriptional regulator
MDKKNLAFNLVTARMLLENLCDGFDTSCSSKKSLLTTKIKMLHLLNLEGRLSPSLIICKLGVAKSNLAILASTMIKEGLIEKVEDTFDKRVIYYNITQKGQELLNNSLQVINEQVCDCALASDKCKKLNKKLDEVIKLLN